MNKTRFVVVGLGFLAILVLAWVQLLVPWIPELKTGIGIGVVLCIIGMLVLGGWFTYLLLAKNGKSLHNGLRIALSILSGLFVLLAGFISSFGLLFFAEGGFFSPKLVATYSYPEQECTLYVYDSSFLDPEFALDVREGWLPVTRRALSGPGDPNNLTVTSNGEWVETELFRYHFPTGLAEGLR